MKLEKTALTEWLNEEVAVKESKKIPSIQRILVSRRIIIKPIMKAIKRTYIQ
jgi:hypothetical protein